MARSNVNEGPNVNTERAHAADRELARAVASETLLRLVSTVAELGKKLFDIAERTNDAATRNELHELALQLPDALLKVRAEVETSLRPKGKG